MKYDDAIDEDKHPYGEEGSGENGGRGEESRDEEQSDNQGPPPKRTWPSQGSEGATCEDTSNKGKRE